MPLTGVQTILDPLLPSIFSVKKKNNKLSYTQCVCYIPLLLLQFSFLRLSVQLERWCSPPRHAFPSSCLVFLRGIRNFLAITYSNYFCRTCHFQVAWTPASLFSAILVFLLTNTMEGCCQQPSAKMFFVFQSQKV